MVIIIARSTPNPHVSTTTTTTGSTTGTSSRVMIVMMMMIIIRNVEAFQLIPSRIVTTGTNSVVHHRNFASSLSSIRNNNNNNNSHKSQCCNHNDDDDDDNGVNHHHSCCGGGTSDQYTTTATTTTHILTKTTSFMLLLRQRLRQFGRRFDTIHTSTAPTAAAAAAITTNQRTTISDTNHQNIIYTSGIGNGLFGTIKKIHNPIVYFIMGIMAGFRYDWCFRSPVYWFAIGFTIKWYRARYVFKIPVWDRQPNWNNIITSKEQEKDLKAFTCIKCGSTIFIAKTREFFFEGNTGIGGLGCFSCGARGKENFVMDRDRIVEDVGDMDDYFEYERPLDFISRAERRKLLKEAQGDENIANQLLLERTTGITSSSSSSSTTGTATTIPATIDAMIVDTSDVDDITTTTALDNEMDDDKQHDHEVMEIPPFDDDESDANNELNSEFKNEILSDRVDDVEPIYYNESRPNGETIPSGYVSDNNKNEDQVQQKSSSPPISSKRKPTKTGLDGLDELDMDAW